MKRSKQVSITKIVGADTQTIEDLVAVEEPLQITVDGIPIAVVMRTVGDDKHLITGFLITEGIIHTSISVRRIDLEQKKNHALVFLEDDVQVDLARLQRNLYSASSCGICGKASMDEVFLNVRKFEDHFIISRHQLKLAPSNLQNAQHVFEQTGGLHAAALVDKHGDVLIIKEDVGRHNAIDKAIGSALTDGIDLTNTALQLSGRVSFEVVQKALMVGIPLISAISAPTSLAVEFAERGGITLIGFMRDDKMNIYSRPDRVK